MLGSRNIASSLPSCDNILRKLIFEGKHPHGWIVRVERFFRRGQYPEEQKLELVSLSLEGDAISWYHGELTRETFKDWMKFKRRLLARFSTIKRQNISFSTSISILYSNPTIY